MTEYTRRAGYGPVDPARRPDTAAADPVPAGPLPAGPRRPGRTLRDQMATLPDPPDPNDSTACAVESSAKPCFNIMVPRRPRPRAVSSRPSTSTARSKHSKRRRGATDAEQANTAFNDYGPLVRLGRVAEARRAADRLPRSVRGQQQHHHARQDAKRARRRRGRARPPRPGRRPGTATRCGSSYLADDPRQRSRSATTTSANYLSRAAADPQQVGAHRLAAAVIDYQTGRRPASPQPDGSRPAAGTGPTQQCRVSFDRGVPHCGADPRGAPRRPARPGCPSRAPDPDTAVDEPCSASPETPRAERGPRRAGALAGIRCCPPCTPPPPSRPRHAPGRRHVLDASPHRPRATAPTGRPWPRCCAASTPASATRTSAAPASTRSTPPSPDAPSTILAGTADLGIDPDAWQHPHRHQRRQRRGRCRELRRSGGRGRGRRQRRPAMRSSRCWSSGPPTLRPLASPPPCATSSTATRDTAASAEVLSLSRPLPSTAIRQRLDPAQEPDHQSGGSVTSPDRAHRPDRRPPGRAGGRRVGCWCCSGRDSLSTPTPKKKSRPICGKPSPNPRSLTRLSPHGGVTDGDLARTALAHLADSNESTCGL